MVGQFIYSFSISIHCYVFFEHFVHVVGWEGAHITRNPHMGHFFKSAAPFSNVWLEVYKEIKN